MSRDFIPFLVNKAYLGDWVLYAKVKAICEYLQKHLHIVRAIDYTDIPLAARVGMVVRMQVANN